MKLTAENLKDIIKDVEKNKDYQNISTCLRKVLNNCYYSSDLFYTIEYIDIIMNNDKKDNSYINDFRQDLQKMLLYALKNRNIKFNEEYFDILIELSKLDILLEYLPDSQKFELSNNDFAKINPIEYNKLLFILSIDYTNPFIVSSDDFLFDETLNTAIRDVFINLIDTYSYYKKSKTLFIKLSKYSPIIIKIILHNSEYIDDLQNRKLKIDKNNDLILILEYNLFIILVGIFMIRIKEFNYDYSLISSTISKIMTYIKDDYIYKLDNFKITDKDLEYLKQCMIDILYGLNSASKRMKN